MGIFYESRIYYTLLGTVYQHKIILISYKSIRMLDLSRVLGISLKLISWYHCAFFVQFFFLNLISKSIPSCKCYSKKHFLIRIFFSKGIGFGKYNYLTYILNNSYQILSHIYKDKNNYILRQFHYMELKLCFSLKSIVHCCYGRFNKKVFW